MTLTEAKTVVRTARFEAYANPAYTVRGLAGEVVARLNANVEGIDPVAAAELVIRWANRE